MNSTKLAISFLIGFCVSISVTICILLYRLSEPIKIELTYYDNSKELLNYDELPYIVKDDSSSYFWVIDSKSRIPGVKQFKIIQ